MVTLPELAYTAAPTRYAGGGLLAPRRDGLVGGGCNGLEIGTVAVVVVIVGIK